jgi:hypothetical protein
MLVNFHVNSTFAKEEPPVEYRYKRFFVHYVDKRSVKEKILNSIGLTSEDLGRSFTLIAGVSHYPNMPRGERELKPAAEDIRKLEDYLKVVELFDEIVVLKNNDVTLDNLSFFLQYYFPERLKFFPKSRFLFLYSGHGMNEGKKGYLLKNTARSLSDKKNSISLRVVRDLFNEDVEKGYHVLAMINACYSGAFIKQTFGGKHYIPQHIPQHKGAHAITAGGTHELTWHDPEIGSGSVFFEKFFAGLDGQADTIPKKEYGISGDGLITVDELFAYIKREVQISTEQKQNPLSGDISPNGSKGGFFFLNRLRQVTEGNMKEWNSHKVISSGETVIDRGALQIDEDGVLDGVDKKDNELITNKLTVKLRSDPIESLSTDDVRNMIKERNFFDSYRNKQGKGLKHQYEVIDKEGEKLVIDQTTGLIWQQLGSSCEMRYSKAAKYIKRLNTNRFADYDDWRLPTLEEAMSLIDTEKKNGDLYISKVFNQSQRLIWTTDKKSSSIAWVVDFSKGYCNYYDIEHFNSVFVRAVRLND